MDKSKKKISITLVMCIIALLLIIGGSYALWNKNIETENSGLEVYSTELNLLALCQMMGISKNLSDK